MIASASELNVSLIGPFSSGLVSFYLRGKSADVSRKILSLELMRCMLGVCAV